MSIFNVSIFSFFSSIILFNLAAIVIILYRKKTDFIAKHGINLLLLSSLLAVIRLILPIDLHNAKIINIHHIYQPIKKILFFKIGNRLFVYQLLLLIWGIGTLLLLFYYLCSSLFEIYKLNHLKYISSPDIEALYSNYTNIKIVIKVSSEIDVPLVWGFFKCHIYFPNYDLSSDEWKFILDHEVLHIKLHDTFIKIFLLFLTALFWWNPIMYILRKDIDQMLELRCDGILTQDYSIEMKNKYLETILSILKRKTPPNSKSHLTASFVNRSAYSLTRQRFEIILSTNRLNKAKALLYYSISFLLFVSSYFIILQPATKTTTEQGPTLILHTSENNYELYIDGTFYKNLTQKEAYSKEYSKYEIIEGSN
ncbi:M56 family metallopeptidase [Dorea amylophila]|uniref:M56 family metallopeptidase n=1 Tax=Dorea amylophila TaxID=2981789 RepID=UPI0022E44B23|nr:M56 family metallopeptidase [Dorea amylophila]